MKRKRVVFISPPFYSQFAPILALAEACAAEEADVWIAVTREFEPAVRSAKLSFIELKINYNSNTGVLKSTKQPAVEKTVITDFVRTTAMGPIPTLLLQSRNRKRDMFYKPETLIDRIASINKNIQPDLWVVDQLSYAVTLSLYCLQLPFASFITGHPYTLPSRGTNYSVPADWPHCFKISESEMKELCKITHGVQRLFTLRFNRVIRRHSKKLHPVKNAFTFASSSKIIFNYPPFRNTHPPEYQGDFIYLGYCFSRQKLPQNWRPKVSGWNHRPRIMIVLGTFLSCRVDVVSRIIRCMKKAYPASIIFAASGGSKLSLRELGLKKVIVKDFLPQRALMPFMDLLIFHAGCSSFVEALYHGTPIIALPFSSDQFNLACDIEKMRLGEVLDPNNFKEKEIIAATKKAMSPSRITKLLYWKKRIRALGPRYGARRLLNF